MEYLQKKKKKKEEIEQWSFLLYSYFAVLSSKPQGSLVLRTVLFMTTVFNVIFMTKCN